MDRPVGQKSTHWEIANLESGLGVPCGEAQADGVPCGELGVLCSECERARAVENDDLPERRPETMRGP